MAPRGAIIQRRRPVNHSPRSVERVERVSPPEDKIPSGEGVEMVSPPEDKITSGEGVERVSPPEDKIPSEEKQHAVVKNFESQYDVARAYVKGFKMAGGSLDSYEKPLSVKISRHDWIKLSRDLEIFDTDQKYRISFYDP